MNKPRLLDLFCGAGGAGMGYHRAGFEVVGVDIKPQPHYPFEFHQADALDYLRDHDGFAAIHASPPCQQFTRAGHLMRAQGKTSDKPDLILATRWALMWRGLPYVIENVEGAPLIEPATVCGSALGLRVRRHRLFESSLALESTVCRHREQGRPVGVYGSPKDDIPHGGRTARDVPDAQDAMGIDWMPRWDELKESIPPKFTEWVGRQVMDAIRWDVERAA